MFNSEPLTRSSHSALDLVSNEFHIVLIADLPDYWKVLLGWSSSTRGSTHDWLSYETSHTRWILLSNHLLQEGSTVNITVRIFTSEPASVAVCWRNVWHFLQ